MPLQCKASFFPHIRRTMAPPDPSFVSILFSHHFVVLYSKNLNGHIGCSTVWLFDVKWFFERKQLAAWKWCSLQVLAACSEGSWIEPHSHLGTSAFFLWIHLANHEDELCLSHFCWEAAFLDISVGAQLQARPSYHGPQEDFVAHTTWSEHVGWTEPWCLSNSLFLFQMLDQSLIKEVFKFCWSPFDWKVTPNSRNTVVNS